MRPDWQFVATSACIVFAGIVVIRQIIGLFIDSGSRGCGSCSACPGKTLDGPSLSRTDFVSLDTVIASSRNVKSTS